MKRKFSFNLAPVRVPPKGEFLVKSTPEPSPAPARHSSHQPDGEMMMSSISSPWINRRVLDPKTERDLQTACALIAQDFKSTDQAFDHQAKPKLDFGGPHRPRAGDPNHVYKPVVVAARPRTATDAKKQTHKPDTPVKDGFAEAGVPVAANIGRRRGEIGDGGEAGGMADKEAAETRRSVKGTKAAMARTEGMAVDSDDGTGTGTGTSIRTPLTGSTEAQFHHSASTAPTSAAVTSSRSSKRESRQHDHGAGATEPASAAVIATSEREKRRHHHHHPDGHGGQASKPPSQAPSRSRSIRDLFSASRSASRKASVEMTRTQEPTPESQGKSSSHGWRSWGLQRKTSSRSSSRPGTSKGRAGAHEPDEQEVNLNRELPPLPSLDSWNKLSQANTQSKQPVSAQGAHIATVMRAPMPSQLEHTASVRRQHRRSGSDSLMTKHSQAISPRQIVQTGQFHKATMVTSPKRSSPPRAEPTAMDFDQMMSAMDSQRNFDEKLRLDVHVRNHSLGNGLKQPSMSMDQARAAPNFSRKISADMSRTRSGDWASPNPAVVLIPDERRGSHSESKSKLRKVFSSWTLKKEKKPTSWMDDVEQNGIKTGIMVQNGPAMPPIVRY